MKNPHDFSIHRRDFPMLAQKVHDEPLIYLDTAATSLKPQIVIDSISQFYTSQYGTVHRAIYEFASQATAMYEGVREQVRAFLNAKKKEEIIFTRGTTDSINLVASSFGKAFIKQGDEILISEMEHHSNIVPWQMMCAERGAVLKIIPITDKAELDLEAYRKLLNPKTKIVSIAHIANSTGTLNPIKEIISLAHLSGAKVLIDGAQSAPHLAIDVQDLDADFFVFSGHKVYGPTGIGILYGKESLLELMPPHAGGGEMIATVTFAKTTYNVLPLKFEAGTPPIAEVIGLGAALKYIQNIGLPQIEKWENQLLEKTLKGLQTIEGIRLIGSAPERGAIISFVVDNVHPLDIGTLLDLKGIAIRTGHQCAQPTMQRFNVSQTCRVSFGLYNNLDDVLSFLLTLEHILKRLK